MLVGVVTPATPKLQNVSKGFRSSRSVNNQFLRLRFDVVIVVSSCSCEGCSSRFFGIGHITLLFLPPNVHSNRTYKQKNTSMKQLNKGIQNWDSKVAVLTKHKGSTSEATSTDVVSINN